MKEDKLIAALKVQSVALDMVRATFRKRGLIEIMPVVLSTVTDPLGPDPGSSIIGIPEVEYQGQRLVLTQSMIMQKQVLVSSGLERFFIVSPNVRLESPKNRATGRHLFEFSQVDFELAHAEMKHVFDLLQETIMAVVNQVKKECSEELAIWDRELKVPEDFPIVTTDDLIDRYGLEWEDKASGEAIDPFWVLNHKREFYDAEDPGRPGFYRNYDLIYPEGFGEALSGGEREWDYDRIVMRLERDGFSTEDYKPYLEFARSGLVPSAGGGLGVERLTRFLVGASHIGDIQAFRRVPGEAVVI
ncbi:MAG: asparagine synthetase A [Candidatus Thorarchaeota archaeon]|jgi:asparaginyl-tRNA synthetase